MALDPPPPKKKDKCMLNIKDKDCGTEAAFALPIRLLRVRSVSSQYGNNKRQVYTCKGFDTISLSYKDR